MILFIGLVHGNGWFLGFWLNLWDLRSSIGTFHYSLELSFDFVLDFFHELDIFFGLDSFIFLVEDLNFLDFVLVKFDLSLKMGIFFPQLFHIFDDFFDFDSILFGGNLIINFFNLHFNFVYFLIVIFERVLLNLEFFLEL